MTLNIASHLKRTSLSLILNALLSKIKNKKVVLAIGFRPWKEKFVAAFAGDYQVLHIGTPRQLTFITKLLGPGPHECWIWSFKDSGDPAWLGSNVLSNPSLQISRVEDGFIRSIGRGLDHCAPWSLCKDRTGMYFDASAPSDFEYLCNDLSEEGFAEVRDTVECSLHLLKKLKLSKYNGLVPAPGRHDPQPLDYVRGSVLVLGQVEDDQSIMRNENMITTNVDLIARARTEHPTAIVRFKQHPDCVGERSRPGFVTNKDLRGVEEVDRRHSIYDVISSVDHVYTISSLGGFEALLHGRQVTTFGSPFYAGWGLTTDHCKFPRRTRQLSILELFYVSYIAYPTYFNPSTGERIELCSLLRLFDKQLSARND